MKTADAIALIAARLGASGIEDPRREARILLAAMLGTDAAGLLGVADVDPSSFEAALERRVARAPMAYILGRREFWGMNFMTSAATLIPRPDSETLIEAALASLPDRGAVRRILDLGTGTGCLLLAALHEFSAAFGVGVDIAPAAAALAARNAAALNLAARTAFLAGDWARSLDGTFDLVLSNPPYIQTTDLPGLMPEVARFEPMTALDGGPDGLMAYRSILPELRKLLAPGGIAVLELGAGQADEVAGLADAENLAMATRADLNLHLRAAILTRRK